MSLMEKFLPNYQFSERHQTTVRCGPGELLDIIQNLQPPKDRFSDLAMSVRQLPARLMHRVAPLRVPRPSPFTPANFIPLARDGDREILAGLIGKFWRPDFGLTVRSWPFGVSRLQSTKNRQAGDRIYGRASWRRNPSNDGDKGLLSGPLLFAHVRPVLVRHSSGQRPSATANAWRHSRDRRASRWWT